VVLREALVVSPLLSRGSCQPMSALRIRRVDTTQATGRLEGEHGAGRRSPQVGCTAGLVH